MPEWVQVVLRTLAAVVTLFILTKMLGKRQVTQLSVFEYITGITIGGLAAVVSLEMQIKWYLGIIALCVWVAVSLGIEYLQLKSKKARDFIDGKARVLVEGGKILEDNLKKERLTTDELLEQLRRKKAFRVADVEFAVMDPNGDISVLMKREFQPLTAKHLGVQAAPEGPPQAVVMDGKILDQALTDAGRSRGWLTAELEARGVALANVFLGQVDTYGELYLDLYDDKIQAPPPQKRAALYALLKKCEADLELFAIGVQDKDAKRMYGRNAERLQALIRELKPYLHT